MAEQEQVLVVKRDIFGQDEMFRGLMFDMQPYLDKIFARGALRFMPRPAGGKRPDV